MATFKDFLNNRIELNNLPEGYCIYIIQGEKHWMANGDMNDKNYTFVVAARNPVLAKQWAGFVFLTNSDCSVETYSDIKDILDENALKPSESAFFDQYSEHEGWVDMGGDIVKRLELPEELTNEEASVILRFNTFDDSNVNLT
ncbi:hypothetical protein AMD27_16825 (plasmid) [Acinetobacter sp. TGL-Y2]|uniref:hypothetical protein n=1 Tax=Acinetobacter sp. TGL-Y2 TaxID=1407071 RepID=UPI0007A64967|nr:hypothetical protein [Acinetobacter sp. TGL-Y2]AMW80580.1 hypothetical protein AMD27_16825 [Acinetobacter sp. TGL-Y2]